MTKEEVTQKIRQILARDPLFKDADLKVHFVNKSKNKNAPVENNTKLLNG